MVKVDLHTHSILSYDGGLTESDYRRIFEKDILNVCAITDHDEIVFAQKMAKKYPNTIVVGQEISTLQGHIIGLFLREKIPPRQHINQTISLIKAQDGLVYLPHPLERQRHGVSQSVLQSIISTIDIIEIFNARSITSGNYEDIKTLAQSHHVATSSSSDAHSFKGIGSAFNIIEKSISKPSLVEQLSFAKKQMNPAPFLSRLAPSLNKIRNKVYYPNGKDTILDQF